MQRPPEGAKPKKKAPLITFLGKFFLTKSDVFLGLLPQGEVPPGERKPLGHPLGAQTCQNFTFGRETADIARFVAIV